MSIDSKNDRSRRRFLKGAAATTAYALGGGSLLGMPQAFAAGSLADVTRDAAAAAKKLMEGRTAALTILHPSGSLGNISPVAERWTADTGVAINYVEVPLGEIDQKVLLEAVSKTGSFDLALPASFRIPDLVESGVLVNLDKYALEYQPADYQEDSIYTAGDYYKGSLYGYATDGDTYLMFYLEDWLENEEENKAFSDKHGYRLKVPDTWQELDAMMAHFHRPDKNMYGGALFRTQYFIAWEWWVRFHAKGFFPFDDDMKPQINNEAGVKALEELVAASKHQYPGAASNGLFENFEAYAQGDKFCNIGWGGTQKFLNSDKSKVKGKLAFGNMPGGEVNGKLLKTPYFNWGWNYVVNTYSKDPELAYLFSLYACGPEMSTIATRDPGGYFDPTRSAHYKDPEIMATYSPEFLVAHEASMRDSIPDLYLKGQGEYFDALRVNIQAADVGKVTPQQAMDETAQVWERVTRRMGARSQKVQWNYLKSLYPAAVRAALS